ncbi:MAG: hypothetical protein EZS28_023035 [Streblomastix strix]|uniref:Uncharacterized protein n=1 Tax=Streblomastix strix TaxID=222440 RepID=A0A5J4VFU8_9EUKA|nr:MAG: hypothetical protein EZS28_023035 [Streblomastix strix]
MELHLFVDNMEEDYYVTKISNAVRFGTFMQYANSSFTVTKFEKRSTSSFHGNMSGELRKQQKEELEQDGEIEELDKDRVSPPLTREDKAKKQNADQTFDKLLTNVAAHRTNADGQ